MDPGALYWNKFKAILMYVITVIVKIGRWNEHQNNSKINEDGMMKFAFKRWNLKVI